MKLYLYDTKTRSKRLFSPADPKLVRIYVCGPTVYDRLHIGNGRCAVVFDVLVRLLRRLYSKVRYVSNITDVDDKINAAAKDLNEPISRLTERFIDAYHEDIKHLGVLDPDVEPRATQHIDAMQHAIKQLITNGCAYEAEEHVLFHVPSNPNYGSLSGRTIEGMLDGARVEIAPYKKDPKDFVLWKPSTSDLPGWDSPWGRGRPGWHIECSTMIKEHLGPTIDIHGGGNDLIFPHHENELAQSTSCDKRSEFVRYWVHNGMLTTTNQKMSKSLGNFFTINDLLQKHNGEILRYALLSGHYRQSLVWDNRLIEQAKNSLDTLYQAVRTALTDREQTSEDFNDLNVDSYPPTVLEALCDDLNTPRALAAMHSLAANLSRNNDKINTDHTLKQLLAGGWLLGILHKPAYEHFHLGHTIDRIKIEELIERRAQARAIGNFALADSIRDQLAKDSIELQDSVSGTTWKTK